MSDKMLTIKAVTTSAPSYTVSMTAELLYAPGIRVELPLRPPTSRYLPDKVTCPNGHQHTVDELTDFEAGGLYTPNLCPDCGEQVEDIRCENPDDVAQELGLSRKS